MLEIIIKEINKDSIKKLYCDFGFSARSIGDIFGLTEDAIFKKMKKYGVVVENRGILNTDVVVRYDGVRKADRRPLTDADLIAFHAEGKTDAEIGRMYSITGEGVAYRRKKLGLGVSRKTSDIQKEKLLQIPTEILQKEYYELNQEEFSNKYGVSKTIWRSIIQDRGIVLKTEQEYPPLSHDQITLIIGGLLGDGGIDETNRYYESHSLRQEQYLRYKMKIMEPYTSNCYSCDDGSGLRFTTVQSRAFSIFRDAFYRDGVDGKLIPLKLISENWDEVILAYWFIDDGYYDDESRFLIINNFCPIKEQLSEFVTFLENKLGWEFQIYKTGISFSKKFYKKFFEIVRRVATPDVLYKIPEEFLDPDKVNDSTPVVVHPKFYRVGNDKIKARMYSTLFDQYWGKPFPYSEISDSRAIYLSVNFKKNGIVSCVGDTIGFNTSGMELCEKFFKNIYECKRKGYPTPLSAWFDRDFFSKLIENRLKYADRINNASMRKGMKLMNLVVSNFKPSVAKYLYSNYCPGGKILDYSAGFGSRMLAAMSLGMEYVGYEPNTKTYANLLEYGAFLRANLGGTFRIHNEGSEGFVPYKDYFDIAFSSPPYFDYEIYSDEPTQSINKFPNLSDWMVGYWEQTIKNCVQALNKGGIFGVCYSPNQKVPLLERTIDTCRILGYNLFKVYKVPFKHVTTSDSYEVILLFSNTDKSSLDWFKVKKLIKGAKEETLAEERKKRNFPGIFDDNAIKNKFKELSIKMGVSRETYQDKTILGAPAYVIERRYGTWNKFIEACGLVPRYQAETPIKIVSEYFKECLYQNRILSFYEYGKIRGNNYNLKMKRLFNAGKKYSHLKGLLFQVAADTGKQVEFLKNLDGQ